MDFLVAITSVYGSVQWVLINNRNDSSILKF